MPAGTVEECIQKFIEIDQAWKILGNEETKKEYDLQRHGRYLWWGTGPYTLATLQSTVCSHSWEAFSSICTKLLLLFTPPSIIVFNNALFLVVISVCIHWEVNKTTRMWLLVKLWKLLSITNEICFIIPS